MGFAQSIGRSARTIFSSIARSAGADTLRDSVSGKSGGNSAFLGVARILGGNVSPYSTFGSQGIPHQGGPQKIPPPYLGLASRWGLPVRRPDYNLPVANFAMFTKIDGVTSALSSRPCDYYLKFDPIKYARINPMMRLHIVMGSYDILGRNEEVWVVQDFAKNLERDLILLLITLHKLDMCFSNLTISDLFICGDCSFVVREGVKFVKLTSDGVDKDFANAAVILESLLLECPGRVGGQVPPDHQHLFGLMKSSASKKVYLIATHVALLTMIARASVFRKFHFEVMRMIPAGKLRRAILDAISIEGGSWDTVVDLNHHMKSCKGYKNTYDFRDAGGLLELLRNLDAHKENHCRYLLDGECELIQYAKFPSLFHEVQTVLWERRCLGPLRLEDHFTCGRSVLLDSYPRQVVV